MIYPQILHLAHGSAKCNVALMAAARTTDRTYPPSNHVELQIYGTGWPSEDDLAACRRFHVSPWEARLDIALGLADSRFRRLGRRLVYIERPDLLQPADRSAFDDEVARRMRGGDGKFHWTTLPQAFAEIDELIAASSQPERKHLQALRDEMVTLMPT